MVNGIYQITFRGEADWGMGLIVLNSNIITGADVGGALYDGGYQIDRDTITIDINLIVPPGVMLVQGTLPQPVQYTVPIRQSFPVSALTSGQPLRMELPPGPVNVIFKKLRAL